jgi:uncharacterized membrane protein (TIGR02234 family)
VTARVKPLVVLAILVAGAVALISSTQTWMTVTLADGAAEPLAVAGSSAIAVLTPLSLAALAVGGALSVVGLVLRYVFGALTVVIAVLLGSIVWEATAEPGTVHVSAAVTEATGISGAAAISELVAGIALTPWPAITVVACLALLLAGVTTLATAHRWGAASRRYRTDADAPAARPASRPHDAIDSWDDLSRGEDPTA